MQLERKSTKIDINTGIKRTNEVPLLALGLLALPSFLPSFLGGAASPPPQTPHLSRPTGLEDSLTGLVTCLLDGWFVDWFDYSLVGWLVH